MLNNFFNSIKSFFLRFFNFFVFLFFFVISLIIVSNEIFSFSEEFFLSICFFFFFLFIFCLLNDILDKFFNSVTDNLKKRFYECFFFEIASYELFLSFFTFFKKKTTFVEIFNKNIYIYLLKSFFLFSFTSVSKILFKFLKKFFKNLNNILLTDIDLSVYYSFQVADHQYINGFTSSSLYDLLCLQINVQDFFYKVSFESFCDLCFTFDYSDFNDFKKELLFKFDKKKNLLASKKSRIYASLNNNSFLKSLFDYQLVDLSHSQRQENLHLKISLKSISSKKSKLILKNSRKKKDLVNDTSFSNTFSKKKSNNTELLDKYSNVVENTKKKLKKSSSLKKKKI